MLPIVWSHLIIASSLLFVSKILKEIKINTELLQVLRAVTVKITVFYKVTPGSLYQVSEEPTACIFMNLVLSSSLCIQPLSASVTLLPQRWMQ
jgi:hypothetical protein